MRNRRRSRAASLVAAALLAGPFTTDAVTRVLAACRGRATVALRAIAESLVAAFGAGRRPRRREVAAFLAGSAKFRRAFGRVPALAALPAPAMQPAAGPPERWAVPAITSPAALAVFLGITRGELRALAARLRPDPARDAPRFGHYHHQWIARRARLPRLIEAPKARLKIVQRRILDRVLAPIPPHSAAHGFVAGRSAVGFAAQHSGQRCVLRMDVQDFFASFRRGRVLRVFLNAGYPEDVAALLADLCTTTTPLAVTRELESQHGEASWPLARKLKSRHLPQGAPTSPALANLCAFGLDARLTGLAGAFAARYSRYADDLVFSGGEEFARCEVRAAAILLEEGLAAAHRKTRIMPGSVSQRVVGLVLNERPSLPRRERDRLKAILSNCVHSGPWSQNRAGHRDYRAHLLGLVAHATQVHAGHGAKLRALFDRIRWEPGATGTAAAPDC